MNIWNVETCAHNDQKSKNLQMLFYMDKMYCENEPVEAT